MLSILDTIFLFLIVFIIIVDNLIGKYEDYLPALSKFLKYGNFAYREKRAEFLNVIEIPKSLYRHFYANAVVFGITIFVYAVRVYFFNVSVNRYWYSILYFLCQKNEPSVSVSAALLTLLLIIVQSARRYYETYYIQVFSKSAKMNFFHYIVAHVHYYGVILAVIGEAPLFCGDQNREKINWIDFRTAVLALPCIVLFAWAWTEQLRSNVILANLRRDKKSGKVVTEDYKVPVGRLFNYVSSPHRFCVWYFSLSPLRKLYFDNSPDKVVSDQEKPVYAMLNILDVGFIFIATFTFVTGYFIKQYERHLPAFIIQTYKYGSFAHDGVGDKFVTSTEIPKAFYKHFYAFSTIFSVTTLLYAVCVYFLDFSVSGICFYILSLLLEQEKPSVSVGAALLTLTLIVVQSLRRYYETFYLQVFSEKARMNLSHYGVGFVHYFGVIVAAIGEAPLFCGEQDRSQILWMDAKTKILALPITAIFALVWWEQYKTNIILANLRRDKNSGAVVSQEYKIPHGRLFNYVSSPHRLCEITLYLLLLILTPTKTYLFIFMWVLSNQLFSALLAHNWYIKKFEDYPKNRKAIFPGVL